MPSFRFRKHLTAIGPWRSVGLTLIYRKDFVKGTGSVADGDNGLPLVLPTYLLLQAYLQLIHWAKSTLYHRQLEEVGSQ